MKKLSISIIFLLFFLLTSCYDYVEVNSVYYAASMGIDYHDENKTYTVYIYILNNLNLSQIEIATSEGDKLAYVAKATNTSLPRAFFEIYENSDVLIDLHHLKTVIFSTSFFNETNCIRFYQFVKNSFDLYMSFCIYTTNELLDDIFIVQNFTETSAYYTLLTHSNNYSNYHLPTFVDFANDIISPNYTVLYPVLKLNYDIFHKDDLSYVTLYLSGYSALKPNFELYTFDDNQFYGINYLNNLTNFQLSILIDNQVFVYDIHRFKVKVKLKKKKLMLYYYIRGNITVDDSNKFDRNHFKNILIKDIEFCLNDLFSKAVENKIDFFNVNHQAIIKNSNVSYETVELGYHFDIILI